MVRNTQRESSRSSRYESKTELQDIKRKYKDVDYVDEKNGVWNTKIVESMELENMMSQAAKVLNNGETRHESRWNQGHDHEDVPEREGAVDDANALTIERSNIS